MSEVAEKAGEITAEVVEESIDGIIDVVEVAKSNPKIAIAAGVVGLVAGGVGGYFIAKKQLETFYEDQASDEIAEAKSFYANLYKVGEDGGTMSPKDVLIERHGEDAAVEALSEYQGVTIEEPEMVGEPYDDVRDEELLRKTEAKVVRKEKPSGEVEVTETVTQSFNTFADDSFDLVEETKFRTPEKPYIITHDEFYAGELNYDTGTLTYYKGDDTLVNESDNPLEDVDNLVGEDHLVRFGSGSKDPNIVFVRNEKLEIDYEIHKSEGTYLEEVLGLEADKDKELRHSADQRRAFRRGEG